MTKVGWTAADTRRLGRIARQAPPFTRGTGETGLSLASLTAHLLHLGLLRSEAFDWVTIWACTAGTPGYWTALADLWQNGRQIAGEFPVQVWSQRVGALGPLAWLAGLTLDEAAVQHAAGGLDEDTLRAMAALRGYRFPG